VRPAAPPPAAELEELTRAARLLAVRSRREAVGLFAGAFASAFRGGGIEFEESRPYVPGDDVRSIDWNTTARTGEPHVKRFREERDRTVVLALDASASMAFGSGERSKAQAAARVAALIAAAAGRAGDRVGLVLHHAGRWLELRPERGLAHGFSLARAAAGAAAAPAGGTDLVAALERARALARRRAVLVAISDFRDDALFDPAGAASSALAATGRRHELVAIAVEDPREAELPAAGPLRLADPERPGAVWLLDSGARRARERYRAAARARRRALERGLRAARADVLWLSTADDPLRALLRFFRERTGRVRTTG
jgi:uncharacterized protein (DUF58 family)